MSCCVQRIPVDCLVAFEYVGNASSGVIEYPGMPLALAPTSGSPASAPPEEGSITGFACSPTWTIYVAVESPEDCWDCMDQDHENGACTTLFTLVESGSRYGVVKLANGVLSLELNSGEKMSVGSSTAGTQLRAFKASPMLIGISCGLSKEGDLVLRMAVSVSGSVVLTEEVGPIDYFQPISIVQGDRNQKAFSSLFWWGGEIDESNPTSVEDMTVRLQSLDFLIED